MSRDQGEALSASLHAVPGCVPFPRKDSDTSAAGLDVQDPDTSPWEGHLEGGKQLGSVGNLSTMYLSIWCCDDLPGSLAQCLELPQDLQPPSPLQREEGQKW